MKISGSLIATIFTSAVLFTACTKTPIENPEPVEQEVITTIRLVVTNSSGFNKTFNYKVLNDLNFVDEVVLAPSTEYDVEIKVLNESLTPTEDITEEVLAESNDHLFVLESNPATGAGAISFTDGSKDADGNPLNQKLKFTTGEAGNGVLTVTLKHEPTNKNAGTAGAAGGETDAEASFTVKLQ